ncbi:MAG: hypothetical protein PHE83_18280 [Opitutaceae bacterium]|nr:hypothetical protein [Opitutaceae bacterium]
MMDWGICTAPAVIRRGDDRLWSGSEAPEPLVPEAWPSATDPLWLRVRGRILDHFYFAVGYELRQARQRPLARARLRLAHPDDEALIDQIRGIHNGEVAPEYDPESGGAWPMPRTWRYEIEWRVLWIIELVG